MFGINLVIVAIVTELCTHSISAIMLLRYACCIPVLILKSRRHNFSQIMKFGVISIIKRSDFQALICTGNLVC